MYAKTITKKMAPITITGTVQDDEDSQHTNESLSVQLPYKVSLSFTLKALTLTESFKVLSLRQRSTGYLGSRTYDCFCYRLSYF